MRTNRFISALLFIAIGLTSCTSNDDRVANEQILNGPWFLVQSCNADNEECTDLVKGNYILDFNQANGTVVIEKNGTKFPPSNYEIKTDALGSWLFIDEDNRGRLVMLTPEDLVLRSTQISVLPPNPGTRIQYYVR